MISVPSTNNYSCFKFYFHNSLDFPEFFVIIRDRKSKFIDKTAREAERCIIKVRQIRIWRLKYSLRHINEYSTFNDNF